MQPFSLLFFLLLTSPFSAWAGISSSLWCHGSHEDHRHCSFNNLCYYPYLKQYLFFHSINGSTMSGIDDPAEQTNIARLSSITGNPELYLNYVSLHEKASDRFDIEFVDSPTILVKRWRPQDPFHMIHDDLIPIFSTLKFLCFNDVSQCVQDYVLAFEDEAKVNLYENLFPNLLYLPKYENFFSDDQVLCFKKIIVGLEHDSLWFNHGFESVSGAVDTLNFRPQVLEEFRFFVLNKLNIEHCQNPNDILLFQSELLNNTQEIKESLKKTFKIKTLDLKKSSFKDLIKEVSCSRTLIGFFSSFNILALFLPQNPPSGILEIFPYALDQSTLPQFATLAKLRNIRYQSWINFDPKASVANIKAASVLNNLDPKVAEAIVQMDHVAPVSCCNDPALIYKLNQVTNINVKELLNTLRNLRDEMRDFKVEDIKDDWIILAPVHSAKCDFDLKQNLALVTWKEPLNLSFMDYEIVSYEALAQAEPFDSSSGNDHLGDYSTPERRLEIVTSGMDLRKYAGVKVSIMAVLDHGVQRSSEVFVYCDLDNIDV